MANNRFNKQVTPKGADGPDDPSKRKFIKVNRVDMELWI